MKISIIDSKRCIQVFKIYWKKCTRSQGYLIKSCFPLSLMKTFVSGFYMTSILPCSSFFSMLVISTLHWLLLTSILMLKFDLQIKFNQTLLPSYLISSSFSTPLPPFHQKWSKNHFYSIWFYFLIRIMIDDPVIPNIATY